MISQFKVPIGLVLALGLAVATDGWSESGEPKTTDHKGESPAVYTLCAEVDDSLSGDATAIWSSDLGPSRRWTRENPHVVLEAGADEGISVVLVAEVYFGGAQFIAHDEVHVLAANELIEVPIDLASVSGLHARQQDSDALVRVSAYELDEFGHRNGNLAMLSDLLLRDESSGRLGMRLHLDEERDALDGEPPVLADAEIQTMRERMRARRAPLNAPKNDRPESPAR